MQQFSLEKWLENPSRKVVTRNGRPVTIICPKSPYNTIVGFCGKDEYPDLWDLNGKYLKDKESGFDLFFADEEEILTKFEKDLQIIISEASHWTSEDGSISTYCQFGDKEIKKISVHILDLARKEIQPEIDKEIDKAYKNIDTIVYDNGYKQGQYEIMEDLPKWKKMPSGIQGNGGFNPTYLVRVSNGYYFTTPCLSWDKDSVYIELSELEKLPKE